MAKRQEPLAKPWLSHISPLYRHVSLFSSPCFLLPCLPLYHHCCLPFSNLSPFCTLRYCVPLSPSPVTTTIFALLSVPPSPCHPCSTFIMPDFFLNLLTLMFLFLLSYSLWALDLVCKHIDSEAVLCSNKWHKHINFDAYDFYKHILSNNLTWVMVPILPA
jgi:hypothetical protein